MLSIPQIDFKPMIETQKTIAFRNSRELNSYFSDCANAIYDTYDSIFELEQNIKRLPKEKVQSTLDYLEQIKPLVTQFLDLLQETDFDCKNRDRLISMLEGLKDMLSRLIQRLTKIESNA